MNRRGFLKAVVAGLVGTQDSVRNSDPGDSKHIRHSVVSHINSGNAHQTSTAPTNHAPPLCPISIPVSCTAELVNASSDSSRPSRSSDAAILNAARSVLATCGPGSPWNVTVEVIDGIVILRGTVPTHHARHVAHGAAMRVRGARTVENLIRLCEPNRLAG